LYCNCNYLTNVGVRTKAYSEKQKNQQPEGKQIHVIVIMTMRGKCLFLVFFLHITPRIA